MLCSRNSYLRSLAQREPDRMHMPRCHRIRIERVRICARVCVWVTLPIPNSPRNSHTRIYTTHKLTYLNRSASHLRKHRTHFLSRRLVWLKKVLCCANAWHVKRRGSWERARQNEQKEEWKEKRAIAPLVCFGQKTTNTSSADKSYHKWILNSQYDDNDYDCHAWLVNWYHAAI